MRQRRQGLQVSTFPFLAVLLCAMGSLILLLLVIDRRARVVARAKAVQAAARATADSASQARARQEEIDRRRQALHAALARQDADLQDQLVAARRQAEAAFHEVRLEQGRAADVRHRLETESTRLAQWRTALARRRQEAIGKGEETDAARRETARLGLELAQLEQAVADLKAARERRPALYSLVPYRGRNGDARRPIYVECAPGAVLFHPDRLALRGADLKPTAIRAEVERRLARAKEAVGADAQPYVLLLIRPDGITSYYRTLAALDGLPLAFGYELVEADWTLDFPEGNAAPPEPWMVAGATPARDKPLPAPLAGTAPRPLEPPAVAVRASGMRATTSSVGGTDRGPLGRGWPDGPAGLPPAGSVGVPAGAGPTGEPGIPGLPGQPEGKPSGPAGTELGAGNQRSGQTVSVGQLQSAPSGPRSVTIGLATPGGGPAGGAAVGLVLTPSQLGGQTTDQAPPPAGAVASPAGVGLGPPHADSPMSATVDAPSRSGGEGSAPAVAGRAAAGGTASRPNPAEGTAAGRSPGTTADEPDRQGGAPSGQAGPPPSVPATDRAAGLPPAPPRLVARYGNRDVVLVVECRGNGIVLAPTGLQVSAASLVGGTGADALREAVRTLVARRQGMVRPGEPAYHVAVRFVVRADGLRTYYLAFPALEPLGLPMSREDPLPELTPAAGAFAR